MKLLNLGCGHRFHSDWVNIDFKSTGEGVQEHNLLEGIPDKTNEFDVVYHSHVLEHFSKSDGKIFLEECYRVTNPGGLFRCAVPDLERIVRLYLKNLEKAFDGDNMSAHNYDWMMMEMYDQTVRNYSGGEMAKYLRSDSMPNEKFVISRMGEWVTSMRNNYFERQKGYKPKEVKERKRQYKIFLKKKFWINFLRKKLFLNEIENIEVGKFRKGGEIHQWMYDRYSLSKVLSEVGFKDIQMKTAFESDIPEWNKYELDIKGNNVIKPDSLFIEARK